VAEQALVVNVRGFGLLLVTGCRHPQIERIFGVTEQVLDLPVRGVLAGCVSRCIRWACRWCRKRCSARRTRRTGRGGRLGDRYRTLRAGRNCGSVPAASARCPGRPGSDARLIGRL
jgi:hypothetical protein